MNRLMKILSLMFVMLLTLGLLGCNSVSKSLENEKSNNIEASTKNKQTKISSSEMKDNQVQVSSSDSKIKQGENITEKENQKSDEKPEKPNESKQTISNEASEELPTTKAIEKKNQTKETTASKSSKESETITTKVSENPASQTNSPSTVSIKIVGPKDIGVVLETTKISLNKGDTILDVLLKVTKKYNMEVEYSGRGSMAYIEGIDNLYEFDYGPKSGWKYKLNDTTVNQSSDSVKVKENDRIEWIYLEDFTEDGE